MKTESNNEEDEEQNERFKKMQTLLHKDEQMDKGSKEYQQEILRVLTSVDKQILDEDQLQLSQSMLFSAKDLRLIIKTMNEYKKQISMVEESTFKAQKQMDEIKKELSQEIEKGAPNIEEITSKLVKEKVDEERKRFDYEKEQMIKDLQNRVEKVLKLEMELDEVKDAYRSLESSLSKEDQQYKNRAQKLEKSLEQITSMYQSVINEKAVLKVDIQVAEKKIQRKEEKIT